jgi:dipeptidyl aminopeptidase/acylaminoacyl peptidase
MVHRFNGKGIDMIDIYATKADAITTLSDRSRGLSEYTLGETRKINYRAQDGYTLEGFLTIPPGSNGKALPLVVTTPDNAWSKQVEGYGADIQFFATRGYAVFRPNYRGTTGRGRKHMALDSANLSALIQDDIADGVRSLVKDGTADSSRIFLFGEYYGGLIAILSTVRHPGLYKGVVTKNAILDLPEQYDFLEDGEYHWDLGFLRAILNSQKPSKKIMQQHSPRHLISDIKTPLLVFHGKNNATVDVKQAENFRDAAEKLKNGNISVKLIDKEQHTDWDTNNNIYWLEKSLELFEKSAQPKPPE